MLIGYARVSTNDQETATPVAALKAAGRERIYREKASGGRWDRPELHRLLDQLRESDVLVVWKLDRLSGSLRDVLTIMERLTEAKAGFRSLTEAIDTTTPAVLKRQIQSELRCCHEFYSASEIARRICTSWDGAFAAGAL